MPSPAIGCHGFSPWQLRLLPLRRCVPQARWACSRGRSTLCVLRLREPHHKATPLTPHVTPQALRRRFPPSASQARPLRVGHPRCQVFAARACLGPRTPQTKASSVSSNPRPRDRGKQRRETVFGPLRRFAPFHPLRSTLVWSERAAAACYPALLGFTSRFPSQVQERCFSLTSATNLTREHPKIGHFLGAHGADHRLTGGATPSLSMRPQMGDA